MGVAVVYYGIELVIFMIQHGISSFNIPHDALTRYPHPRAARYGYAQACKWPKSLMLKLCQAQPPLERGADNKSLDRHARHILLFHLHHA